MNNPHQILDNFANNSIEIIAKALAEKDQIIQELKQKLANCNCPEVPHA